MFTVQSKLPLVHVNIGFLANDVCKTTTNTFDGGHGKHDLLLSINICVLYTKNVLKVFICHKRLPRFITSQCRKNYINYSQ